MMACKTKLCSLSGCQETRLLLIMPCYRDKCKEVLYQYSLLPILIYNYIFCFVLSLFIYSLYISSSLLFLCYVIFPVSYIFRVFVGILFIYFFR